MDSSTLSSKDNIEDFLSVLSFNLILKLFIDCRFSNDVFRLSKNKTLQSFKAIWRLAHFFVSWRLFFFVKCETFALVRSFGHGIHIFFFLPKNSHLANSNGVLYQFMARCNKQFSHCSVLYILTGTDKKGWWSHGNDDVLSINNPFRSGWLKVHTEAKDQQCRHYFLQSRILLNGWIPLDRMGWLGNDESAEQHL